MKNTIARLLSALLLLGIAGQVAAQQLPLEACRKHQDEISHYNELRRQGGSSAQMDAWKRARREHERLFRAGNCRYYRLQLK